MKELSFHETRIHRLAMALKDLYGQIHKNPKIMSVRRFLQDRDVPYATYVVTYLYDKKYLVKQGHIQDFRIPVSWENGEPSLFLAETIYKYARQRSNEVNLAYKKRKYGKKDSPQGWYDKQLESARNTLHIQPETNTPPIESVLADFNYKMARLDERVKKLEKELVHHQKSTKKPRRTLSIRWHSPITIKRSEQ